MLCTIVNLMIVFSQEQRQMVLGWKDTLDDYNNGTIGPGPCEEEEQY